MTRSSEGDILRQGSSSVMPSKVQILSLHHLQSWVSFLCHNMAAVSPSIVSTSTAEGGAWAKGRLAESTHLSLESQNFPQKLSLCFLWWDLGHTVLLPGKSHGRRRLVGCSPWGRWGSDMTEQLHLHSSLALEKEMAAHSSVLAWRTPGTGEPGGLPSMGSHRVRHDWSDLAAAAAAGHIVTFRSITDPKSGDSVTQQGPAILLTQKPIPWHELLKKRGLSQDGGKRKQGARHSNLHLWSRVQDDF